MSKPTFLEPLIGMSPGQTELINAEDGTALATYVEPAFDSRTRKTGLLGRDSVPEDYALILAPCSAVHTFSMRFPIDVLFVSRNGTITKTGRSVKPWRITASFGAHAVIETAPGFIDRHGIVPGETLALREIPLKRRATDALPGIAATSTRDVEAAAARHRTAHPRVTLAVVVAGKTPLEWSESVAVVQECCEAVLARGPADDPRVPELRHIGLTAEGRVRLLAEGPAEHSPVHRMGLVLLALTPEEQLPMQLRLLVLEEVSPRPRLKSLFEFHRELEFFERPDRQSIVSGVYRRFQLRSAEKPAAAGPPPLLEPPSPTHHLGFWKQKRVRAGSLIVLMTLAAAAGIWAWPRPEARRLRETANQAWRGTSSISHRLNAAARREVASARSRLGLSPRLAQPDVPVVAVPSAATAAPAPAISLQGGASAPPLPSGDLRTLRQASILPASPPPVRVSDEVPPPVATPSAPAAPEAYSAADTPRVVPPELISPRARPSQTAIRDGSQPQPEAELVISAAGEVESVRLVSGRATALSGMQISAIKTWRFQPATRDGLPVRYRLRIPIPTR